jgi:hypothetical protein
MNAKLVTLWIYLSYAVRISGTFNASNMDIIEVSIESMTRQIVEKYFSHDHCVGIIVEHDHLLRHIVTAAPTVLVLVSTVPKMADSEEFQIFQEQTKIFDKIIVEQLNQGCLSFIIQVNSPELLVEYFYRSSRRSKSRSNRRYLFLPPLENFESYDATRIFRMKEMAAMPNVAVAKLVRKDETVHETCRNRNIVLESDGMDQKRYNNVINAIPHNCTNDQCFSRVKRQARDGIMTSNYSCPKWDEIEIVTHRFVGSNPETELWLDTWTSGKGFLRGANIYPNKMRNLQGKLLYVAAVPNYPPYTIINTNLTPPVYDGIELRFVKDFARQLNFTFRVVTDEVGWWGEVSNIEFILGATLLLSCDFSKRSIGYRIIFGAFPSTCLVQLLLNTQQQVFRTTHKDTEQTIVVFRIHVFITEQSAVVFRIFEYPSIFFSL